MDIEKAFPSKYLKASDLNGAEPVVTMDRVEFEPVGQKREMKAVLYFKGKEKGVVLNKTNANKIVEITGSGLTEDWVGCQIRLFASETQFAGETVDCIRVKPVGKSKMQQMTPAPPPPAPAPAVIDHSDMIDESDIPFMWLMPFILPLSALALTGLLA